MTENQEESRKEQEREFSEYSIVHDIYISYPLEARVQTCARLVAGIRLSKKQRNAWLWEAAKREDWAEAWLKALRTDTHHVPIGSRGDVITDRMILEFVLKMVGHSSVSSPATIEGEK